MKLYIQGALPTLNQYINAERSSKFFAASMKKNATRSVALQLKTQVKEIIGICHYTFIWHCKDRRIDPDNICYAKKFILDGMVSAGIISNDGWANVAGFIDIFVQSDSDHVEIDIVRESERNA
ncbi:MAG: hypothetical protein DRR06_17780 [Gammaproteobacteria bacterium]|nr:MAG: hypothetical protein DRR06_17780 [Gammaproteobacteria bacterium]